MYINQMLLKSIQDIDFNNKVLVIYGPRRVGKTTLLQHYLQGQQHYHLVSGEDIDVQHYLSSQSIAKLTAFMGDKSLLVVDEAQKIPNVGLNLKLLVDHCPGIRVIATGSSAFDLANHFGEPLTGRKVTLHMFPLSQMELNGIESLAQTRAMLEQRLLYGSYPEVVLTTDQQNKQAYLRELVSAYLYKDILALENIRKPDKIMQLLQLLALQIGSEVSHHELGQQLGMSKETVERYTDLLQKTFVLYKVTGYSGNLRKEVTKKPRYYFYDLGIRNAIINQFNPLQLRQDVGQLWENYIILERLKKQHYQSLDANNYFWRTYSQQEVDWVEARQGKLFGYEVKWRARKVSAPSQWLKYSNAEFSVVNQENYLEFIT
jgi:predicted AAA+ superfamily ATPase